MNKKGGFTMRTWRVGTISMGASLLFLGIFLLLSQLFGWDLAHVMIAWWPVILVILGIEILVFLFTSKQEKPFLKYDFLSIFFVGVIGTVGIGLAILNSTNILTKMDNYLQREDRTMELPAFDYQLNADVKKVVVNTEGHPLTIEGTTGKDIAMFGTYRAYAGKSEKLISKAKDYVFVRESGDTVYINVKGMPSDSIGPFDRYATLSATILIPNDVKLEVNGNGNPVSLKPRMLMSDWTIDGVSALSMQIENKSDVKVTATGLQEIDGDRTIWNVTEEKIDEATDESYDQEPIIKQATFQTGKGSHQVQIINSSQVSVNKVD